jgi:hypothetical protein
MDEWEPTSLREFVLAAVARRSIRGWRRVRPRRRELLLAAAFTVLTAFFLWVVIDVAVTSHCLWDKFGQRCEGGLIHPRKQGH